MIGKLLLLFLASFGSLNGQSHLVYVNFSTDLIGQADSRPFTWGFAGESDRPITFNPPPGQIVVIDGVQGDILAFPTDSSLVGKMAQLPFAGFLAGFVNVNTSQDSTAQASAWIKSLRAKDSAPAASPLCDICASNTLYYRQGAATQSSPFMASFNMNPPGGFALTANNQLLMVIATFLNTIGYIHIELTSAITFHFQSVAGESK